MNYGNYYGSYCEFVKFKGTIVSIPINYKMYSTDFKISCKVLNFFEECKIDDHGEISCCNWRFDSTKINNSRQGFF